MDPPVTFDDPLAAGTLIAGRFELVRMVGSGGMGTVWRANDRVRIAARSAPISASIEASPCGAPPTRCSTSCRTVP